MAMFVKAAKQFHLCSKKKPKCLCKKMEILQENFEIRYMQVQVFS